MPSYEYYCSNCHTQFEVEQSVREHSQNLPPCPKCGTEQTVQKQLSSFYAKTSSKR
jgi:putative FmdB family regulatory protein